VRFLWLRGEEKTYQRYCAEEKGAQQELERPREALSFMGVEVSRPLAQMRGAACELWAAFAR
jgi:hypothetical protein